MKLSVSKNKLNGMERSPRLLAIPILATFLLIIPEMRNFYFISFLSFLGAYTLLYIFPCLCIMMHTKPIYVKDLDHAEEGVDLATQLQFRTIFISTINFCMAGIIASLVNYFIYRVQSEHRDYWDLLSFAGGLCAIYSRAQTYLGKAILWILLWKKRKQNTSQKNLLNVIHSDAPSLTNKVETLAETRFDILQETETQPSLEPSM